MRNEFKRYLDCGILANGFARIRCPDCAYDTVVGFSCKGRGFCPSCMGRRMADTAARLVDQVLPEVPVRQWVLSLPWQVRFLLAKDETLLTQSLRIWIDAVFRLLRRKHAYRKEGVELVTDWWRYRKRLKGCKEAEPGGVTAIQRFGSSLNLNVHFHSLILDGVYVEDPKTGERRFEELPEPGPDDLQQVLGWVIRGIQRMLSKKGYFVEGVEEAADRPPQEEPAVLDELQAASIRGWIGLSNEPKRVAVKDRKPGPGPERPYDPYCEEREGYSIHAGVTVKATEREKLEKVCRYLLRPPFAEGRLRVLADGRIEYGLRKARWDGGTAVILDPVSFLEKLAALVPPPRAHLVRYHGVLAPHAKLRGDVVPDDDDGKRKRCDDQYRPEEEDDLRTHRRRKRTDWATLLKRTLGLDALSCPKCGGRMKLIAMITEPGTVRRILRSMGLPWEPPARPPPWRPPQGELEFDQ